MKQISGTFQYANGQPVANGRVFFRLSQDAVALSTAQVAPTLISITLNASGQIPANSLIFFNDELSPALTTYTVSVLDASNALQWGAENIYINGASFNLNNATPTSLNVLLANPVVQNPTSQQNINGQVLNLEGTGLGFSAANSATADTFVNRQASGTIGLGTTVSNTSALLAIGGLGIGGAAAVANGINIPNSGVLQFSGTTTLTGSSTAWQLAVPFTKYNNVTLVKVGVAYEVANSDLTTQAADVGSTTLYAVPASGAGMYRLSLWEGVTQAASVSSTLPALTVAWTDASNSTGQTIGLTSNKTGNTLTTNSTNHFVFRAKASTNITFSTTGYASAGGTPMQFEVRIILEYLGA